MLKSKKLWIIVGIIIILVVVWNRWNEFKKKWVLEQQKKNEALVKNGQTPADISNPTVYNFITGGDTTDSGTTGGTTNQKKVAIIDALETKHNYNLSYGQRQSLMTLSLSELEQLMTFTTEQLLSYITTGEGLN